MSVKDAVVTRIKIICETREITYNTLANISGITPSTIYSMMDNNRRDLSILTIKKICDGLEITLSEFFSDQIFNLLDQEIH